MPPSSTFSDENIDPLLVLEDEMRTRDLNSDDTSFSEHGGTSGSTTSQYGEDDVEQDEDLVGHTNTDSTARTITDRAAHTNANPSSFRPVADFCQQLKRRKLLRPKSEAELDVYAVCQLGTFLLLYCLICHGECTYC